MYNDTALYQYNSVDIDCRVAGSSQHNLVTMLFEGIQKNVAIASGAIERNEIQLKGGKISKAIQIIDNLRASLDLGNGGDLAENLRALYDYMERRLVEANLGNDRKILAEVCSLVEELKEGWRAIPAEYRR